MHGKLTSMANQLRMKVRAPRGATIVVELKVVSLNEHGLTELLLLCSHAYQPGPTELMTLTPRPRIIIANEHDNKNMRMNKVSPSILRYSW